MSLNQDYVNEFKKLYQKKENKKISYKEAEELLNSLILMLKAAYKPIPVKDKKELEELIINHSRKNEK